MAFDALADPTFWLAALAGGAFGAALGALPSLALTGLLVVASESLTALAGSLSDAVGGSVPGQIGLGVTGTVALGPVFGPHVAFAGGAAATAYASRKGYVDTGFRYAEAKNIGHALGTRADVLVVGALFGALGMAVRQLSDGLGLPFDPVFFAVLVSAFCHRLFLGFPLVGEVRGDGVLDMTPFERGVRRQPPRGSDAVTAGGEGSDDVDHTPLQRYAVEPWLPHQYEWANVATIGLAAGLLGGYVAVVTGSAFLAFGLSLIALAFLACGVEQVPVTYHMTLPASTAAVAVTSSGSAVLAGVGPTLAILVGGLFGLLSGLVGELSQRVFYAHGDTHWDPAAAGIVFGTLLVALCAIVGLFPTAVWVPTF
jgi:MFS family permease